MLEIYSPTGSLIVSNISPVNINSSPYVKELISDITDGIVSKVVLLNGASISVSLYDGACTIVCTNGCYIKKKDNNVLSFKRN